MAFAVSLFRSSGWDRRCSHSSMIVSNCAQPYLKHADTMGPRFTPRCSIERRSASAQSASNIASICSCVSGSVYLSQSLLAVHECPQAKCLSTMVVWQVPSHALVRAFQLAAASTPPVPPDRVPTEFLPRSSPPLVSLLAAAFTPPVPPGRDLGGTHPLVSLFLVGATTAPSALGNRCAPCPPRSPSPSGRRT